MANFDHCQQLPERPELLTSSTGQRQSIIVVALS